MEVFAVLLGMVVIYVQEGNFVSGLTLRMLNEKIDFLEAKLIFENGQRHKDYESLMSKLNEITTKLETMDIKPSVADSRVESKEENIVAGGDGTKSDLNMNAHFKYLIKGMVAEKRVNGKTRHKLDEMNNRMKRELSRLDSEITTISVGFKEHTETVSQKIENLAKRNDEQYKNISHGIDLIVTSHNDKCSIMRNELEVTINKQCKYDSIRNLTETSIEQLWSNMSHSFKRIHCQPGISSCKDAYDKGCQISGVYTMYNHGIEIYVYCDQTIDGGGWTVFQRRMNGEVDFYRNWESYKIGFGNMTGEFWIGNEYLSAILGRGKHELRIDMKDFEGNRAYAKYSLFRIDPETNKYALHVSGYSGDAEDALAYHNGQQFSTKDVDLDNNSGHCSQKYKGGWWYNSCHYSNLNGLYHNSSEDNENDGLVWRQWKGWNYSLKFVEMKFRMI